MLNLIDTFQHLSYLTSWCHVSLTIPFFSDPWTPVRPIFYAFLSFWSFLSLTVSPLKACIPEFCYLAASYFIYFIWAIVSILMNLTTTQMTMTFRYISLDELFPELKVFIYNDIMDICTWIFHRHLKFSKPQTELLPSLNLLFLLYTLSPVAQGII